MPNEQMRRYTPNDDHAAVEYRMTHDEYLRDAYSKAVGLVERMKWRKRIVEIESKMRQKFDITPPV